MYVMDDEEFHYVLIEKYSQTYIKLNTTKCKRFILYPITTLSKHEGALHTIKPDEYLSEHTLFTDRMTQ